MSTSIHSLVHRCRRHMPRFSDVPEPPATSLVEGEQCLGFYQNADGSGVIFTTEGLRLNSGTLIRYRDIAATRVVGDKADASRLELILADGLVEIAEFNGGNDRFRDVWEILRLLDRILAVVQLDIVTPPDLPSSAPRE